MKPWLTIVGIGDDGLAGLSAEACALVEGAELLVGGDRHQAMVPKTKAERLTWARGLAEAMDGIEAWRGRRVVVLATGDPMCHGAGANLQRRFDPEEMVVLPVSGAFSLAAARMRWSLPDVETLSLHNRPIETLALALAPGARVIALSRDGGTPAAAAALLTARGWGRSRITVLEHLGGDKERQLDGVAEAWSHARCADLNTLAIVCHPAPDTLVLARAPGLPDAAFESDGQLTKREVRAATVSALVPLPGHLLWDVGAGSGSVAIEWLRAVPARRPEHGAPARAVAIECNPDRCAMIARNAAALGVPDLRIVEGRAPAALAELDEAPDTVFVGGGLGERGLLEACWDALTPGGRFVANAVTLDGVARLLALHEQRGGQLVRIAVSRAGVVGGRSAFRPLMEVTQYIGEKL